MQVPCQYEHDSKTYFQQKELLVDGWRDAPPCHVTSVQEVGEGVAREDVHLAQLIGQDQSLKEFRR